MYSKKKRAVLALVFIYLSNTAEGAFKRCFKCRSRGELGDCKDKFPYTNASALDQETFVETVPCTSGWCGKLLERGTNTFKDEEYGTATERLCLQKGPPDGQERCASTAWGREKVFMCFCQGDLCNGSPTSAPAPASLLLPLLLAAPYLLYRVL